MSMMLGIVTKFLNDGNDEMMIMMILLMIMII